MHTRTCLLFTTLFLLPVTSSAADALTALDHAEIHELHARFNYAFDANDLKMLATVFTPDGELILDNKPSKAMALIKGRAKSRPEPRHLTTNITVSASPEGATGSAYLTVVNLQGALPAFNLGAWCEDVLVKTRDGWRFKKRTMYTTRPTAPLQDTAR